jgi:predicted  nucleic acid-binding Zn-ribbon protein
MFSYLKQVVDSVESQLDNILEGNADGTTATQDEKTVTKASEPTTHDIPPVGSKLADKFQKLKKDVKPAVASRKSTDGVIGPRESIPSELKKTTIVESGIRTMNDIELVQEPMQVMKTNVEPVRDVTKLVSTTEIPMEIVVPPKKVPEIGKLDIPNDSFSGGIIAEQQEGWGAEDDELDIPEVSPQEKVSVVNDVQKIDPVVKDTLEPMEQILVPIHTESLSDLPLEQGILIENDGEPSETIAQLTPQSSSLEIMDQLKVREEQLMKTKTENAELHQQIEKLSTELGHIQELLQTERVKTTQMSKDLVSLRYDYDRMKNDSSSLGSSSEQKVASLSRALAEKEQSIVGLLQEGENLAKEILRANNTIKKYKKDLEQVKKDVVEKTAQFDSSQTKILQLNSKIATLQEAEVYLEEQVKQLSESKSQLTKRITELEMGIVKSGQETADMKGMIASLESELQKLKDDMDKEAVEVQSAALEEQLSENAKLNSQLISAKQIATDYQSTIAKLVSFN